MPVLLVGTDDGLHTLDVGERTELAGARVTSIARDSATWWALADGRSVCRRVDEAWKPVGSIVGDDATCLLPVNGGLLVGTAGAHLLRLSDRSLHHVAAFDKVAGRDKWYTPWGGPPDVRSFAVDATGAVFANVHVGGIVRSRDGGGTWEPTTLDIHTDVHEVIAHHASGIVLAASAAGLASSADGGDTWTIVDDGLHATYLRGLAVADGTVIVSASEGPDGTRSALYRRPLGGVTPFAKCTEGLPEWFSDNIDTGCLAANGIVAAFGTSDGTIYLSADAGRAWLPVSIGLPPIRCVKIA